MIMTRIPFKTTNHNGESAVLGSHRLVTNNVLIAVKALMQRRVWATLAVEWPELTATLVSPSMTLDQYFTPELPAEKIINIMMGDLQRIWVYARRGWSAPQRIPDEVRAAYDSLVALGFTRHLIAEE
jgi:hypothetical protein